MTNNNGMNWDTVDNSMSNNGSETEKTNWIKLSKGQNIVRIIRPLNFGWFHTEKLTTGKWRKILCKGNNRGCPICQANVDKKHSASKRYFFQAIDKTGPVPVAGVLELSSRVASAINEWRKLNNLQDISAYDIKISKSDKDTQAYPLMKEDPLTQEEIENYVNNVHIDIDYLFDESQYDNNKIINEFNLVLFAQNQAGTQDIGFVQNGPQPGQFGGQVQQNWNQPQYAQAQPQQFQQAPQQMPQQQQWQQPQAQPQMQPQPQQPEIPTVNMDDSGSDIWNQFVNPQ